MEKNEEKAGEDRGGYERGGRVEKRNKESFCGTDENLIK